MGEHNEAANGYAHPDIDADAHADAQLRRGRWTTALETLSPIWFSVVMNTGILGILMHQLPYQFSGLPVLSTIMFVLSLVLLVVITTLHLMRVIFFPRSALRQTLDNPDDMCLWGCAPIAFLTLTAQVSLTASQATWGGHAFTVVAYVLWWIATFLMVATSLLVYITFCEIQAGKDTKLPSSIFIPAVGTCTDAVVGALIATYSSDISPRLAVPVIVVSWILLGYGFFLGLCAYVLQLGSFFMNGFWLPPAKWPTLLLFVGPMGQSAAGIQLLGTAAMKNLGGYGKGTFLTQQASTPVASFSVVIGLLFMGFDLFWLFFAIYAIAKGAIQRAIPFSPAWWGTIFPVATLNTALLALSIEMDSPAFRVLTAGLLIILFIDYFVCWGFTIYYTIRGRIFDGRQMLADLAKKEH